MEKWNLRVPSSSMRLTRRTFTSALGAWVSAATPTWSQSASDLFEATILHDVRLILSPSDWRALQQNYNLNTYYAADSHFGSTRVARVGIRSRGSGSRNPTKPGLKVDFNRYVSGQSFQDLKAVVLDNSVQDPTMLQERVNLRLFHRAGIPAPRASAARLYVNDEYYGVYSLIEPIDKSFLKRVFNDDRGYLYEYSWSMPWNFELLDEDPATYCPGLFEPKTNEKEPDAQTIFAMVKEINERPAEPFPGGISRYIDLPQLLNYLAVETYLNEWDGFLGAHGMNNFYLFRAPGSSVFRFLPWDKDLAFLNKGSLIWDNAERNVLTRRAFLSPELRRTFLACLMKCAEAAGGAGEWLENEISREYAMIREAALKDEKKPFSNEYFEATVEWITDFARQRPESVIEQVEDALNRG
jgi:spore coat protein CotH